MNKAKAAHRTGGFTLVEVLVTIVILSIGLLGVAALQASTMRSSQSAYFRSQAATLGQQIVDAMRANRAAALEDASYDTDFDDEPSCDTNASLAACDLDAWKTALSERLPNGRGKVSVDAADVATVCIRWAEPKRRNKITASADACSSGLNDSRQFEFETVL